MIPEPNRVSRILRIPARPSKEDQMGVSVEALKSEIKGYNYEVITGGDDAVAQMRMRLSDSSS